MSSGEVWVIGVDPGLKGAIARIAWHPASGEVYPRVLVWDCPIVKAKRGHEFDVSQMAAVLDEIVESNTECWHPTPMVAAVERGIPMPQQASNSTYKQGRGQGLWEGMLAARNIPYELVNPQAWKKALDLTKQPKDASRARAAALFPATRERLTRKKDDGRAEAILIAEWRRRQG